MLILTHRDLLDLLPPSRIIEAVESGVRALQAGAVAVPELAVTSGTMPLYVAAAFYEHAMTSNIGTRVDFQRTHSR